MTGLSPNQRAAGLPAEVTPRGTVPSSSGNYSGPLVDPLPPASTPSLTDKEPFKVWWRHNDLESAASFYDTWSEPGNLVWCNLLDITDLDPINFYVAIWIDPPRDVAQAFEQSVGTDPWIYLRQGDWLRCPFRRLWIGAILPTAGSVKLFIANDTDQQVTP